MPANWLQKVAVSNRNASTKSVIFKSVVRSIDLDSIGDYYLRLKPAFANGTAHGNGITGRGCQHIPVGSVHSNTLSFQEPACLNFLQVNFLHVQSSSRGDNYTGQRAAFGKTAQLVKRHRLTKVERPGGLSDQ